MHPLEWPAGADEEAMSLCLGMNECLLRGVGDAVGSETDQRAIYIEEQETRI
jgi:hypothetical protein